MSEIEIVVPFLLPPAELATDLLRELALPGLAMLLSRGRARSWTEKTYHSAVTDKTDIYARSLPHEQWLSQRFGMQAATVSGGSPPIAALLRQSMQTMESMADRNTSQQAGCWFVLQPVHFHIARDHLVLTDTRQLALSEVNSQALFKSIAPFFIDLGMTLIYGNANYWFVLAEQYHDLRTATPDATCGHNIDIWMPQGNSARAWRKLQNEIQMTWHTHEVNEERASVGLVPVNSAWLWGGCGGDSSRPAVFKPNNSQQSMAIFNFAGWLQAFAPLATSSQLNADAASVITHTSANRLLWLDMLTGPALAGDWAEWRLQLQALETQWFAPMLTALTNGQVQRISLILSKSDRLGHWSASRTALRKFWIKPTLAQLTS